MSQEVNGTSSRGALEGETEPAAPQFPERCSPGLRTAGGELPAFQPLGRRACLGPGPTEAEGLQLN